MPYPDMAISLRKITRHCCEHIACRAFELAMKRKKKVIAIHNGKQLPHDRWSVSSGRE